jgi:hypothetical protein
MEFNCEVRAILSKKREAINFYLLNCERDKLNNLFEDSIYWGVFCPRCSMSPREGQFAKIYSCILQFLSDHKFSPLLLRERK